MRTLVCRHCRKKVRSNKNLKHLDQHYCGDKACQAARKLLFDRQKYKTNPTYRSQKLEKLIEWRGKPSHIRVDNGPEFIAHAMALWAESNSIDLKFITKGKPHKNGYVERFNRSYREEVLDSYLFDNIKAGQLISNAWLWTYNNERPHSSLKYNTPVAFLLKYGKLHNPQGQDKEFPTFQQDIKHQWKSIILNATN